MTQAQKQWTLLSLLKWSTDYLQERGFSGNRLLVERLLAHVLQLSRVELYLGFDRPLAAEELAAYKQLFKRILEHEPLQYVLGETEFMSLMFSVGAGVLIPRPETELLVEKALAAGKALGAQQERVEVLDAGTGSGCIAISLAVYLDNAQVTAIDRAPQALQWTRKNVERHQLAQRIDIVQHDLLQAPLPQWQRKFDILVANPPYIRAQEYDLLAPEIKRYEPREALWAGEDGLIYYQRLALWAREVLKEQGHFYIEIGDGMADAVLSLFRAQGFQDIALQRDLADKERLVHTITRGEAYE